jgi:tetratricopeptide (TPR) repeat protein
VGKFAPVLKAIVVTAPPDPQAMLDEAAKEIGDQRGKPHKKDGGIAEKAGLVAKGIAGGFLLGAGRLLNGFGRPAATSASPDKLREWAEKNWQLLVDSRAREIERLMKLMETDPDQGLRHALPLAGIEQSRGVATPTWKLGLHNIRFSLGHGGGAIDGWDIATDARLKLERQYRDAALRETALGRYERAAYILGNLLGDWAGAAKSLADAGLHREAVAVYLHKLNNRIAAAKCLEGAGLMLQAASTYAEAKQFEKAGDLHARLGNDAQAREFWRAEIDAQRDPLGKARILARKLHEHQAALDLLDEVWQTGNRPDTTLAAMFAIHRECGETREALDLMRRMFERPVTGFSLAAKLHLSHQEVAHWQETALTRELDVQAYRRIGMALGTGNEDTAALLAFLPNLDPADVLLARDAKRFSIRRNPPNIPSSGTPRGILRPQKVIPISRGVRWDSISQMPGGLSIAGYGPDRLAIAQFRDNQCRSSALRIAADPGNTEIRHFVTGTPRSSSRLFHFPTHKRIHYSPLNRKRAANDDALDALRHILATGPCGANGDFGLLEFTPTSSLVLHIYSEAAILRRSLPIDLAPPQVLDMDWRLAGHGQNICLTANGFLAWRHPDGEFATVNLGETPSSLHLPPVDRVREALITLSFDVLLVEIPKPGKPPETINLMSCPGHHPVACYLPDGSIVIAHDGGGVIHPPGDRVNPCATLFLPKDSGHPIAVASRGDGGFAILTDTGNLLVFAF